MIWLDRFKIATRTMYRWLKELGGENEINAEGGEVPQGNTDSLSVSRRLKTRFSPAFKATVLAAYSRVGPIQAARQFGVSQGVLMQWRRNAGVPKFTDGLKKSFQPAQFPEDPHGGKQEGQDAASDGTGAKSSRRGMKRPFYSADLRSRVLAHYR